LLNVRPTLAPGTLLPFAVYQHTTLGYTLEQWVDANHAMLRLLASHGRAVQVDPTETETLPRI
jgi:hypothetical protein